MMAKLTKAQRVMLDESSAGSRCVKAYKPASRLVEMGLAEWRDDDEYGGVLHATEAGLACLAQSKEGDGR